MPASFALHNAFDGYSDFSENVYFSLKYNKMATTAELDIDLKPQKTSMASLLGELTLSDWNMEVGCRIGDYEPGEVTE